MLVLVLHVAVVAHGACCCQKCMLLPLLAVHKIVIVDDWWAAAAAAAIALAAFPLSMTCRLNTRHIMKHIVAGGCQGVPEHLVYECCCSRCC